MKIATRWRFRLVALVAGLAIALLLAEWVFRGLVGLGLVKADIHPLVDVDLSATVHRYARDPELLYECRPGAAVVRNGVTIRINGQGFRGPDFPGERSPGVRRVAVIGDSVAFGEAVPEAALLTTRLAAELSCEVLNFSVIGYNSRQERIVLDRKALPLRPDDVVLTYVMNDVGATDGIGALRGASHPDAIASRLHSWLLAWLIDRRERATAWGRRSFEGPRALFARLREIEDAGAARTLVVLFPQLDEARGWHRPEEYDEAKRLAEAEGLDVLDLRAAWNDLTPEERGALYLDRTHLSPKGHAEVARLIADRLR